MFGTWYSIQETGKEIPCAHYHLEEARENHYHGHFYPLNVTLELDPKNIDNAAEGYIISASFDPTLDQSLMRVFATDYDTYAGIFTCKEFEDIYYTNIAFWSRTTSLSDERVTELRSILTKYEGIDLTTLKKVHHDECSH